MTRSRRSLSTAVIVLPGFALLVSAMTAPAHAAVSKETRRLCDGSPVACSVQAPSTWVAGSSHRIGVTGNPGTEVTLRVVAVSRDKSGAIQKFTDLVDEFTLEVNDDGFGGHDLLLPQDTMAGDALVVVADAEPEEPSEVLGAWTKVLASTPVMLGDGYGRRKPVGVGLELRLDAARPGAEYVVEMENSSGWDRVSPADGAACASEGTCHVVYEVPRGLRAVEHSFRLVDIASGTPVQNWKATPDPTGDPEPYDTPRERETWGTDVDGSLTSGASDSPVTAARLENLQLPDVAADLAFRGPAPAHLETWVRTAASGTAAVAVLWAAWLLLAPRWRRRSRA